MQDQTDFQTIDLFPANKRRRGRPVTGNAKTGAERTRAYRERLKLGQGVTPRTLTLNSGNSEIEQLRIENAKLQAEIASWRDLYYKAENQHRDDIRAIRDEQKRSESALKGQLTKCRNENSSLRANMNSLAADLSRAQRRIP